MPTIDGADLAQTILTQLGENFTLPAVSLSSSSYTLPTSAGNPLHSTIDKIDVDDLTQGVVGGTGAFDKIMMSHKAHLREEYDKGRITGDQYAKAYIELTTAAMGAGVQMVLGREQAYWQALLTQSEARKAEIEAVTAGVMLEAAKAQLAALHFQVYTAESQMVLTRMQVATEDAKYNVLLETLEAKRAETMDTRSDGVTPVAGMMGKQQSLYDQQIDSYKKDAAYKVGKLFSDSWITQKTLNENLDAPGNFLNAEVDEVMSALRRGVNLEADDSFPPPS